MDTLRKHFSWIIVIFASLMFMLGLLYNTFIPEIIVLILIVLTGIFMIFSRKKVVLLGKIIRRFAGRIGLLVLHAICG
jgi:hypothetical protein